LVEHADEWGRRRAQQQRRSEESRGDAVDDQHVGRMPRSGGDHAPSIEDGQRKGPVGKRHELQPRSVSRRELGQAAVKQIAAREPARVAQRDQDR